jgi:CRP-like cAMP-binding protein
MSNQSSPTVDPAQFGRALTQAFRRSRPESRAALIAAAELRAVPAGEVIVPQGQTDELVLMIDGLAALRRSTPDGRELIPRLIGMGQIGGLLALSERPAAADVVAVSTSLVAILAGSSIRSLAGNDSGLALDVLDHTLDALSLSVRRLDGLLHQGAQLRVARVLQEYRHLFFGEQHVLTRKLLPSLVGTSREMTGRVLRTFESVGIIRRAGRSQLELLDAAGLRAIAQTRSSDEEELPRP